LIETADHFDDGANKFWREAATQFDLIQVRARDSLNWRFCDPRGGPFIVRTAREDGRLLGYVALRVDSRETVSPTCWRWLGGRTWLRRWLRTP